MKLRPIFLLLVLAIVAHPLRAHAQQLSVVSGTLTNALSGVGVPNATVIVESPTGNRQTRSGADGTFSVPDVPAGSYHLVVRVDGSCCRGRS